jgi:hypothetical protein
MKSLLLLFLLPLKLLAQDPVSECDSTGSKFTFYDLIIGGTQGSNGKPAAFVQMKYNLVVINDTSKLREVIKQSENGKLYKIIFKLND